MEEDLERKNENGRKILTNQEEIEACGMVKSILAETFPLELITYRETETYCAICFEGNVRKRICRLKLSGSKKYVFIPNQEHGTLKIPLETADGILEYKDQIIESAARFVS